MTRFALVLVALALAGCGAASEEPAVPSADTVPAAAETPSTAVVVCGPDGAAVETPRVAASRDGVHVEIRNESGAERVLHVGAGESSQGEGFPAGTHTRVWALPPGPATLTCDDPAGPPSEEPGESFEVVDPDGVWVPTALDCDGEVTSAIFDYVADAAGVQGEPVDVARDASEVDVARDDVVEPAGYPDAAEGTTVRVVRDGRAVALVGLMPSGDGGWLVTTVSRCADA